MPCLRMQRTVEAAVSAAMIQIPQATRLPLQDQPRYVRRKRTDRINRRR